MTEQSSKNNDFEEITPKAKNLVGEVSFWVNMFSVL